VSEAAAPPQRSESYMRGLVLVGSAGLFWSLGGLFFRFVEDATVWQIVAWRTFFLALSMTLLIAWRYRVAMVGVFRGVLSPWGLVAAVGTAAANTLFMWSLQYTYVANTVLMLAAAPVISAVLSWFLLREAVRPATMIAMAGVIVGVLVMLSGGLGINIGFADGFAVTFGERRGDKPDQWIGDILAVFVVIGFAFIVVAVRAGRSVEMMPCIVLGAAMACVVTATISLVDGAGLAISGNDLLWCAMMGVVQMTVGMALFVTGARHVPAGELALLSLTEVIFAPIWVWAFLSEVPVAATFWGGGIVFLAIVVNAMTGMRRRHPLPQA
tara:strand:+ start:1234 stop:2211 length:978 start_codon:yes stop_codon:yes gene_type:complete